MEEDIKKKFYQWFIRNDVPLSCHFELTYRCNYRCIHCFQEHSVDTKNKELSTEEIIKILDLLSSKGIIFISLTGGEIFLREDLFEIITYARRLGLIITLQTNGSFLSKEVIERLSKLSVYKIVMSYYSCEESIFDNITGITGSYRRTNDAIALFKENNLKFSLVLTLMKQNFDTFLKTLNFMIKNKNSFTWGNLLLPQSKENKIKNPNIYLSQDQLKNLFSLPNKEILNRGGFDLDCKRQLSGLENEKRKARKNGFCLGGRSLIAVGAYGHISACPQLLSNESYLNNDVNLRNNNFDWQATQSDRYSAFFNTPLPSSCRDCHLLNFCGVCRVSGEVIPGVSFKEKESIFCKTAKAVEYFYRFNSVKNKEEEQDEEKMAET